MCKLQLFWHAGAVPQYRDRYHALGRYFSRVQALVPDGWKEVPDTDKRLSVDCSKICLRRLDAIGTVHPFTTWYRHPGRQMDDFSPDVVYVHEEPQSLAAFQLTREAMKRDVPVIIDSAVANMSLHLMGMNPLEQYVYRHADLIYYRNEKCADVLVARGCPRDKLNGPMPNGVSMCTFAPPDVKSIREFKASYPSSFTRSTSPRVGYAGRIARQKGIHLLLKVAERHPKIQFGFCGTQVDGSLVERISATPNATYFGRLDTGNLISFYGLSDVLLLPSIPTEKWEEQFGRVLTEAIACGTPAAGSDVGMISDIVGTEAVFPPDEVEALEEKVLSLTQPRAARALYRRQKSRLQDHYTWDVVAERVCNDTDVLLRLRNR